MKAIARGAEATVYESKDVVIKDREKKRYRIEEIDSALRKSRTRSEFNILKKCVSFGINVPQPIKISEDGYQLYMERLNGSLLKDEFSIETLKKAAKTTAKMHKKDIVHGDLTTSNIMVVGGVPYLIDFGLGFMSSREEDKATDIFLVKEALKAKHTEVYDDAFSAFLESYKTEYGKEFKGIETHLKDIESRRRYYEDDQS